MSEKLANDEVIERALAAIAGRGEGEVYLRDSQGQTIEVEDGEVEGAIHRGERGIGVRVIARARPGFAYTSDLTAAGVAACVDVAFEMAAVTEPDEHLAVATADPGSADLAIYERGFDDRTTRARIDVALAIERAARATDARINGFRKTTYADGEVTTILATSAGVRARVRESACSASTTAIAAQDGEKQIGSFADASRRFADVDADRIGRKAAERAVGKLGPRPFKTQKLPVLLDPWMGMALLGAIASLFSADAVLKGKSLFAGKIGARVANERVTIVDDGRRAGGLRSEPFDGEGVATTTRTLVERGVLRGYLSSLKTARRMGIAPTGNARRGWYAGLSRIGPANFYLDAGTDDVDAQLRSLDRAIAITSLLNLHTIDPISGEFSLGASGDVLENGAKAYNVDGITIAGNLTSLLDAIVGVGRDLTFGAGGIGSPTLLVSELSIGGK